MINSNDVKEEEGNKIFKFFGEENAEEGKEETLVLEEGEEEEEDNGEGAGSIIENDMENENEEKNNVIEIRNDEDINDKEES